MTLFCYSILIEKETEKMETAGQVRKARVIRITAGKTISIDLIYRRFANLSLPFPLDKLSCQLTDPNSQLQHVQCDITPHTQPGMVTVRYTPTLRGVHQLKITVQGKIQPIVMNTYRVLPSLEMRIDVPINTITGVHRPYGVAVSKRGEVVVSEQGDHCISIFSREGKKIRTFGSKGSDKGQFDTPSGVAITASRLIHVADRNNHRIQVFTMKGVFVRSVGEEGNGPLQFNYPSGIAVHSSGLVYVVDEHNHRIQVLLPNLSIFRIFGGRASNITQSGKFYFPNCVACADRNDRVVYVTDYYSRVQVFSIEGYFISSYTIDTAGRYLPRGICIDSTNTVYVTDNYCRVSAFIRYRQHGQCFGERELNYPQRIAVDNTTGNIYVCDYFKDRVVMY